MSDLYNELIDELEKNDIFVRYSTIEPKIILDLSEHDKPFKVKIRELKESYQKNTREIRTLEKEVINSKQAFEDKCADYDVASNLLREYQRENEVLKRRIQELDTIDTIRIDENRELKQRITELESKETEKPTKINLNDRIKVKLTPLGAEIYYHQYDDVNKKIKENGGTELESMMPQIDKDGYTKFQLWHFMELYVKHIGMCKPNVIEPLEIIVVE